ncbi:melanoma-derived growth regulatory protein isoform 4-T4 [Molossus nigricans]
MRSAAVRDPISIAVALQDYVAPDCRFLTIHRGQVVYVFSKLKGRGRLFWGGSVQGDYYGDMAARLGFFPSSIVREDQTLKPGKIDVKTDVSVLGAGRDLEGEDPWVMIVGKEASALGSQAA